MTTLLITTHGRADLLRNSLVRFQHDLTRPDEILVVDDGTQDDSVERVCDETTRWAPRPLPTRYVYTHNPGLTNCCHARNVGLREARHDEIIVSEPELIFISDVVAQLARARRRRPGDVLHEPFCYHEPELGTPLERCDKVPGFYVNAFRRDWLLDVGGWDERFPGPWGFDDIDLYNRLSAAGHDRTSVRGLEVRHQWHPSRIDGCPENEPYARAKVMPDDMVANVGLDWGRAAPRPPVEFESDTRAVPGAVGPDPGRVVLVQDKTLAR